MQLWFLNISMKTSNSPNSFNNPHLELSRRIGFHFTNRKNSPNYLESTPTYASRSIISSIPTCVSGRVPRQKRPVAPPPAAATARGPPWRQFSPRTRVSPALAAASVARRPSTVYIVRVLSSHQRVYVILALPTCFVYCRQSSWPGGTQGCLCVFSGGNKKYNGIVRSRVGIFCQISRKAFFSVLECGVCHEYLAWILGIFQSVCVNMSSAIVLALLLVEVSAYADNLGEQYHLRALFTGYINYRRRSPRCRNF